MKVEFIIGPAGSGKTYACLAQARAALKESPEGLPLIFLAPKQATFQLERELLSDPDITGYTRLQILSFDRLAEYVLEECYASAPTLLSEEGRVMVLRAILTREAANLQTFRASARTTGFAQELSKVFQELQRNKVTAAQLRSAADKHQGNAALQGKLGDLALILDAYVGWLKDNALFDPDSLLDLAAEAINSDQDFRIDQLWMDGFAEMTPQEVALLAAILPKAGQVTLAFCLPEVPRVDQNLKLWSVPARAFRRCFAAAREICEPTVWPLERKGRADRFEGNPVLGHLERGWGPIGFEETPSTKHQTPEKLQAPSSKLQKSSKFQVQSSDRADGETAGQLELFGGTQAAEFSAEEIAESLAWFHCANPEMEATVAAREILKFVRNGGGRFRDCAVLVRRLETHQAAVQRVFRRYGIPFFVDQRRPVAHHPLAELTRYALRTVAFGWRLDDWFGALKSGLIEVEEGALDRLEIEAIAHGWEGEVWLKELQIQKDTAKAAPYERIRQHVLPPFLNLRANLCRNSSRRLNGVELCDAIRSFWNDLAVERTLQRWSESAAAGEPNTSIHQTVWTEIDQWLDNVQLAFPRTELSIEEWLAIIDAGLCSLTIGVVPPALDQVLIGAVDRSRNPTLKLALVLGMNEGIFPAVPKDGGLLNDAERDALGSRDLFLGLSTREQLAHERYLAYIACTRARQRLVLTSAYFDSLGRALNPSPFLGEVQRLFPGFEATPWRMPDGWDEVEHPAEAVPRLIQLDPSSFLAALPLFRNLRERLGKFTPIRTDECLSPAVAQKLYGPELRTSITRLERFGECQFRFFVTEGLRASEKRTFELDRRKLGDFQHQALKAFHQRLQGEKKRWRDLTPRAARELMGRVAREHARQYHDGLFMADEQDRFAAEQLSLALEDMIEVLVGWMERYEFDPTAVELRFDDHGAIPSLRLPLSGGRSLALNGSIDRVDILRTADNSEAWCLVIDYKSSNRRLDPVLMHYGIQMQLPAYLAVLQNLDSPEAIFGVKKLLPAGLFYISLRRDNSPKANRNELFADPEANRKAAYRHYGRFNAELLHHLDNASGDVGEQFYYRRKRDGEFYKSSLDPMPPEDFARLTESTVARLKEFGEAVFRGEAQLNPFSHRRDKPCDRCDYRPICRVDLLTHTFRPLQAPPSHAS